ncbi:MAG: ABC transporter [Chloroflexi bacterium HGW-Chloroflexi-10]|nr:MAG: ABC transporter [Chloroflexi bacterium HGW-Chloroflexi-10]
MIHINQLTYQYPGAAQSALMIEELHIPAGSFCLVTGQSGSGKSTLLRLINGLVPHFSGGTLQGNLKVAGLDPIALGPQVMSRHVGFVFQEPENQFIVDVVEDEIAFSLEHAGVPRKEMQQRIQSILAQLHIEPLRQRKLETLSGGEAQRVAIAAALVLNPQILVLDEPTSQLDPLTVETVLNLLQDLRSQRNLTILIAEHRLERLLSQVSHLVYINPQGKGCLSGSPSEIVTHIPYQPPVVRLAMAMGWQPLPLDVASAKKFIGMLPQIQPRTNPVSTQPAENNDPILEVRGLYANLPEVPVLKDISLTIQPGERLVIMGPNGAGKSTLLRCLMNLIKPEKGDILLNGHSIINQHTAELSKSMAYLPQDPSLLLFADSVRLELETTLHNHHLPIDPQTIEDLLQHLMLTDKAEVYPRDLSTGERQRTALGAVCITQPQILLLDEPTRGLDQEAKQSLVQLLLSWNQLGKTIVMITHDVEMAAAFANRILILENGQICADGKPGDIFQEEPRYTPQIASLFPSSGWLTLNDIPLNELISAKSIPAD